MSYSNALIKFTAIHLLDIAGGKITPEEMGDFAKGAGHGNPMETALTWYIDFNIAFHALAPRGIWKEVTHGVLTESMLYHLGRMDKRDELGRKIAYPLSNMQRIIVNDCILKGCNKICKRTYGKDAPDICWNENIFTRMRKHLNGEKLWIKDQERDVDGRFISVGEANAPIDVTP
jgi:hypothetical protein